MHVMTCWYEETFFFSLNSTPFKPFIIVTSNKATCTCIQNVQIIKTAQVV